MRDQDYDTLRKIVNGALAESHGFIPGLTKIPLSVPTFGTEEILEAMDSLLRRDVTMGHKVAAFEKAFSEYIDVRNAVMVNSGSSANLIALSVLASPLTEGRIEPGDEIITPAVTWSTTVFPIACVGAVPVFVDVELDTFNIGPEQVEKAITNRTKAIMPVHLLGNPCDMRAMERVASENDLFVVEDACEAHGAETSGRKVGSFGDFGTFSFFFSHHISTIEGGMVVTNDNEYADLARSYRAHGWIRERSDKEGWAAKFPQIDKRFMFISFGYNMRPTEIQGAFGTHQLRKLDAFIRVRVENADYWTKELSRYSKFLILPMSGSGSRHVFFAYPITVKPDAPFTRNELAAYLESNHIETRPIMAGDFTQQPVSQFLRYRTVGDLRNARLIHSQSLLWGNHQGIGKEEREFIVKCVADFIDKRAD